MWHNHRPDIFLAVTITGGYLDFFWDYYKYYSDISPKNSPSVCLCTVCIQIYCTKVSEETNNNRFNLG